MVIYKFPFIFRACDEFILEQARSVIYASTRMDVPELQKVRDLLIAKYTKSIHPDREIGVYPRLVLKLSMSCPERGLCEKYLEAIADNFGVEWRCEEVESDSEPVDEIGQVLNPPFTPTPNLPAASCNSRSQSISSVSSNESLAAVPPPPPYSETLKATLPMDYSKQSQSQSQSQQSPLPDFDEFTRRFEALRKK